MLRSMVLLYAVVASVLFNVAAGSAASGKWQYVAGFALFGSIFGLVSILYALAEIRDAIKAEKGP